MDTKNIKEQKKITKLGNPRKPESDAGRMMLERMNESHAELTARAVELLDIKDGDSVLDIGCGGGGALRRMSGLIKSGHLTGVDYSDVSVALSRENNSGDIAAGKTEIIEASIEALPFADGTFDRILTVESFYFWPHPAENLREVCRVLRRGGRFVIASDVYTHEKMSEASRSSVEEYGLFAPTADEFKDMLTDAGFSDIVLHTEEGSDRIIVVGVK